LQHSFDKDGSTPSAEARKAFSMAERVETHAVIMSNSLKEAEDEILPISFFAPLRRSAIIAAPADVFIRPGKSDSDNTAASESISAPRRAPRAKGGFKVDAPSAGGRKKKEPKESASITEPESPKKRVSAVR
jgi:hypothetical protein